MFNRQHINYMLSMLICEYQIRNEYNLGIFFGDDGTNKDHRVIYLWLETLMDKTPDISFEEINHSFKQRLPECYFT